VLIETVGAVSEIIKDYKPLIDVPQAEHSHWHSHGFKSLCQPAATQICEMSRTEVKDQMMGGRVLSMLALWCPLTGSDHLFLSRHTMSCLLHISYIIYTFPLAFFQC
jgi:hypothetical protein